MSGQSALLLMEERLAPAAGGRGIDDHLGPIAAIFGISDALCVDRLVDQDPQPPVRRSLASTTGS